MDCQISKASTAADRRQRKTTVHSTMLEIIDLVRYAIICLDGLSGTLSMNEHIGSLQQLC